MTSIRAIQRRTTGKRFKLSPAKYRQLLQYILDRDGGCCVFCGSPHNLTGAHVINRSQGGNDSPKNIVTACLTCHSLFDAYKLDLPESVQTMLLHEPDKL